MATLAECDSWPNAVSSAGGDWDRCMSHVPSSDRLHLARRLDAICDQFESSWTPDRSGSFGELLAEVAESERGELLQQLVMVDVELRMRRGLPVECTRLASSLPEYEQLVASACQEAVAQFRLGDSRSRESSGGDSVSRSAPGEVLADTLIAVPESIGRFEILRELGRGKFGAVYHARDRKLMREVAIKVPHAHLAGDQLARFYREARAVAAIGHPHVCRLLTDGEENGVTYLVMDYVPGKPLSIYSKDHGPLPQLQAARIVLKAAKAMAAVHACGVIHRDLKPANIIINPEGEPIITDFGLARLEQGDDLQLSLEGVGLGTPVYMPPEQLRGDPASMGPACDVYSLGVILFELLTGATPHQAGSLHELAAYLLDSAEPPSPLAHRPDLDPDLAKICSRAIRKPPEKRYRSMGDFAADLEKYLEKAEAAAASDRSARRKRKLMQVALAAVLALCGIAAIYISTDYGELHILAHDQHVQIVVREGGEVVRVVDTKTGSEVSLRAGDYEIALQGAPSGVRLKQNRIVLTRGGVAIAEIEQTPPVGGEKKAGERDEATEPEDAARRDDEIAGKTVPAAGLPEDASPEAVAVVKMLRSARMPPVLAKEMETLVVQNPRQARWARHDKGHSFAIVARRLPAGAARAQSRSLMAAAAHKAAVGELLVLEAIVRQFADEKLDDVESLRSALRKAGGQIDVAGGAKGASHEAGIVGDFAVAYVLAPSDGLHAYLRTPASTDAIKSAYRDAVHARIRQDLAANRIAEGLNRAQGLSAASLQSPELALDVAELQKRAGKREDSLLTLTEAFDKYSASADDNYLDRLGAAALALDGEEGIGADLAFRAYEAASRKLLSP